MTRGIVLFGHGSRDPAWRGPIESVARRISQANPQALVRCAYLELDSPDFATCIRDLAAAGAGEIAVVPMFLGMGRHVREDLPRLVETARAAHPAVAFTLQRAVGEDERVLDLLSRIALE